MKQYKKILCLLCTGLVALSSALLIANFVLSQSDYAHLVIEGKTKNYILVNDNQKYNYMPYYNYKSKPDLKIREGKNYLLSFLRKRYGLYSDDDERNFIYCEKSGFGVQIVGLYIKESELERFFKPTPDNIFRVVVYNKDNKEILFFNEKNDMLFKYFEEKYSKELSDYFFPVDIDDEKVFNQGYSVFIEYLNGSVSRFFRTIDKEEVEKMCLIADD